MIFLATETASAPVSDALIQDPIHVLSILLGFLALLFTANHHPKTAKIFRWIPLLVWAYFVPTLLSNTGIIPLKSPLYSFIKDYLLPASLVLLILSVDIPGILSLGKSAVILFLTGTVGIVIGGPIAYWILGRFIEGDHQTWMGLSALAGSWIGGGANMTAVGFSVGEAGGLSETEINSFIAAVTVVDVFIANLWMFFLLLFAGKSKEMDLKMGADRTRLDDVQQRAADYQAEVSQPTNLPNLLSILAIAFVVTVGATVLSEKLPEIGDIVGQFTWVVLIVTAVATIMSFTPLRRLEGVGASAVGSTFLYLLVTSIGAKAVFSKVVEQPLLVGIGAIWMSIHVILLFTVQRFLKAPIFFLAVGSKANVGGAASAPIVASAFHPALAPVGVLLAVGGYVLGTVAALICAYLLQLVHGTF